MTSFPVWSHETASGAHEPNAVSFAFESFASEAISWVHAGKEVLQAAASPRSSGSGLTGAVELALPLLFASLVYKP